MNFYLTLGIGFVLGIFVTMFIIGLCSISSRAQTDAELIYAKEKLNEYRKEMELLLNREYPDCYSCAGVHIRNSVDKPINLESYPS